MLLCCFTACNCVGPNYEGVSFKFVVRKWLVTPSIEEMILTIDAKYEGHDVDNPLPAKLFGV